MPRGVAPLLALALLGACPALANAGGPPEVERVSVSSAGAQANGATRGVAISGSGRYVAFGSRASNLVAGDGNRKSDILLVDLTRGRTTRITVGVGGEEPDGPSFNPALSASGKVVAFESSATNLVRGDRNDRRDVFVADLRQDRIERVSLGARDQEGNHKSLGISMSADGGTVAFTSFASNLVPGGGRQNHTNVFVRDLHADRTTLVSGDPDGEPTRFNYGSSLSANGSLVAFESASKLIAEDTNGDPDIYVRDLDTGAIFRASVSATGRQTTGLVNYSELPTLSADGSLVSFYSTADNLIDGTVQASGSYVKDLTTGAVTRVPADIGGQSVASARPRLSADGTRVVFQANDELIAPDSIAGDPHVFVYELASGELTRVDNGLGGEPSDDYAALGRPSANGLTVAFISPATNLVAHDTNRVADAFVAELSP